MITIERTVDLSRPIQTETLRGNEFMLEQNAHTFRIHVTQDGEAVTLTGSVSGSMLLSNGDGLTLAGSVEDGAAVLTLPQAAYGVPGRFMLAIYSVQTGAETVKTCVYACVGAVVNTYGATQYDPGSVIPDAETLAAYIEACQTATSAANSAAADATAAASSAVRYDTAQTLTSAQQAQARENIGAASQAITDQLVLGDADQAEKMVTPCVAYGTGFYNRSGVYKSNSNYKWTKYMILPSAKSVLIASIYAAGSSASYNTICAFDANDTLLGGMKNTDLAPSSGGTFSNVSYTLPTGTAYIIVSWGNMASSYNHTNVQQFGYFRPAVAPAVYSVALNDSYQQLFFPHVARSSLDGTGATPLSLDIKLHTEWPLESIAVTDYGYDANYENPTAGGRTGTYTTAVAGKTDAEIHYNAFNSNAIGSGDYVGFVMTVTYKMTAHIASNASTKRGFRGNLPGGVTIDYAKINGVDALSVEHPDAPTFDQITYSQGYNPLFGGRLCVIGDSLSAVVYKMQDETWSYLVAKWNNMTLDNFAVSSCPVASTDGFSTCMADIVDGLDASKRYTHIFIMGGANDYNYGVPIGENTDTEITTFKGALVHIMNALTTKFPGARVLFATTFRRTSVSSRDDEPYAVAMREVCAYYGFPCLDNYSQSGVRTTSTTWMGLFGANDGTTSNKHLNAAGEMWVAPRFEAALKYGVLA